MKINEIKDENDNITIEGKIKQIFPSKIFPRKNGNGEGKVQHIILEDKTGKIKVTFWDVSLCNNLFNNEEVKISNLKSKKSNFTNEFELHSKKDTKIENIKKQPTFYDKKQEYFKNKNNQQLQIIRQSSIKAAVELYKCLNTSNDYNKAASICVLIAKDFEKYVINDEN